MFLSHFELKSPFSTFSKHDFNTLTQLILICPKSTIQALEKGVKYVQS